MTVTVDGKISVMVLLHRVWKKHPFNVDFLGFYMPSTNQYSPQAHGLIGMYGVFEMFILCRAEKEEAVTLEFHMFRTNRTVFPVCLFPS